MPKYDKDFKIWLPQEKEEIFKDVTIIDSDGTSWDVDSDLINFEIEWGTIRGTGLASFKATLNSNEREYLNKFSKGDKIKFYFDYTDGTTLYKTFFLEEPLYTYRKGYKVELQGRDYPQIADEKITVDFSGGFSAKNAFNQIVSSHFSSVVNTDGVDTTMTDDIYSKYEYKQPVKIFKDILERVNFDGRFENDGTITTFDDDGVSSTSEAVILGQNVINIKGFGRDSMKEKNRVQVVGGEIEGCLVLSMAEDTDSQNNTWIKKEVFKDTDINNLTDAEDVATYKKEDKKVAEKEGTVTCIGMTNIKPGYSIDMSIPDCNIEGSFFVKKVKHRFSQSGWKTTLDVNETKTQFSDIFEREEERRERERELNNPNAMTDTVILETFDNEEDIDTISNLEVVNGKLKIESGQSSGNIITEEFITDSEFTNFEVRGSFNDDMELIEVEISNNGGYSYKQIGLPDFNEEKILSTTGDRVRMKVTLRSDADNPNPELESICLLIKR